MSENRSVLDLRVHPDASRVPFPDGDTQDQMVLDIEARGVQVPLDILPDGTVLDGRTRLGIAQRLGLAEVPVRVVEADDPFAYMVRMAVLRRHLTARQRKVLAAEVLRTYPRRSDNSVAKDVGLDNETVGRVRAALEEAGEVAENATVIGSDGVEQPAHKPPREEAPTETADWQALRGVMGALAAFVENDADRIAAAVPARNRAATAKRLRKLGSDLGRIAWKLEAKGGLIQ